MTHHDHAPARAPGERRLAIALAILLTFAAVEAAGAWIARSIALGAEAGHMFADCASLALAIAAIRLSRRPPDDAHSYGLRRYQTLAAFVNGLALIALTVWIAREAIERLLLPQKVAGGWMLAVALLGAAANLGAFLVLSGPASLNERGARVHVLGDLLGSGAAIAAALAILGWSAYAADPILSLVVCALVLHSAYRLTRDSAHVLLEGAPPNLDSARIERELANVPGVRGVHHVHVWSLAGDAPLATLHVDLGESADAAGVLGAVRERLRRALGVDHATVQLERGVCDRDSCCLEEGTDEG